MIGHLLDEIASAAEKDGVTVRIAQKPETDGDPTCAVARCFKTNGELLTALRGGELDVVGGTAWVWSREDFAGPLDVLVVDEAGQIALANALAVSPAARSLILLGDPQQLEVAGEVRDPGTARAQAAELVAFFIAKPSTASCRPQDAAPAARWRPHDPNSGATPLLPNRGSRPSILTGSVSCGYTVCRYCCVEEGPP